MGAKFICDCGKEMLAFINHMGDVFKPPSWYTRFDTKKGRHDACSRECCDIIAKKFEVTNVILPF